MQNHIELVHGQLDAYNDLDLKTFCTFYHPKILVKSLIDDQLLIEGLANFETTYINFFSS
jgi:hypothetical protein